MTAIGDKLKEAGIDTLGAEFYSRAVKALRSHASVRLAWSHLGETWGHAVLTRIWNDMQGPAKSELGDHGFVDIHDHPVSQPAGGGHITNDNQMMHAAARSTPAPQEKPFHKQKPKPEERKLITQQATLEASAIWRELKMDTLRVRELNGFIREQIVDGGNHALRAHWQAKRAAIAWQIKHHGTFPDDDALVRDYVSDKAMTEYVAKAERQATVIIAKLIEHDAKEIENGIKLIAAG